MTLSAHACWTLVTQQLRNSILLSHMTPAVCITSARRGRSGLHDSRSIKGVQLTPPRCNASTRGENKLRTKWPQRITYRLILSRGHALYPQQRRNAGEGRIREEREGEEGKKNSITQRLEKQAGELLGRRDCHVCINRHWFFCPALAPQPFILSFVVGAQRGCRNSVTVQLGPWGLCVRIDFTCKRGEGLEPLNKGSLCHQRAGWVKSHWMDNDTCSGRREELKRKG